MQYVGIDWGYRRAAWCAKRQGGAMTGEGGGAGRRGWAGEARLAMEPQVKACVEMMSGAVWVRDRLAAGGWEVQVADARKVKQVASLACKTDRVDARVLAELCWRDLVPAVWVPSLDERALRERLNRRMHLVGLRSSAKNRAFGLLTQWGLRIPFDRLTKGDALELLEKRGMPAVWRRSVAEAVAVAELLDRRIEPLDRELEPLARGPPRDAARDDPRDRAVARAHVRRRDRRCRPLPHRAQARRVLRADTPHPPIRSELEHRRTLQGRLQHAVGRRRGRPELLAAPEPLASALPRRQAAHRQGQPGQDGRRAQNPDRRLARARPQRTIQAEPATTGHRSCPGKLPQSSGRLKAGMELRSRDSSNSHDAQPSAERELSAPPQPEERTAATQTAR